MMLGMQLRESFPLRTYLGLSLLGVGFGVVGAVGGSMVASKAASVYASAPVVEVAMSSEPVTIASSVRANTEAADAPSSQVGFVISTSTGNWFVLPIDATKLAHREGQLEDLEGVQRVTESIRDRDLTPEMRAWRDVRVTVDGTCTDRLHDFALIAQLSGNPEYVEAPDEAPLDHMGQRLWTAKQVQAEGQTYVVAKLAHCTGTYARAASAPPTVAFSSVEHGPHLAQAEQRTLRSDLAAHVKATFFEQSGDVKDVPAAWAEAAQVHSIEVTDPRTGTNWVSVHVHADFACGGPDLNFYDLYRVDGDQLVTVSEIKTDNLASIDALVDLDGDGVPELLGSGWLEPTRAFYSSEMETLVSYELPFFGCPC
ncbi:hypothetical protein BH11MYX1_BH11MYX1_05560 [soil metagenome]